MATQKGNSGTFNIYTKNPSISGYVAWQETYDDATYSSTNESTVTMDVYLHRTNIYSGDTYLQNIPGTRIAYFDSEEVKNTDNLWLSIAGNTSSSGGAYTKVYSASKTIKHDSDGSKSITLGFYMTNEYVGNSSGNAFAVDKTTSTVTLKKIPRYFSSTPTLTLKNTTEFTATFAWTTPEKCSEIEYRIGSDGAWTDITLDANATSGTFTIKGLDYNKTYTIYVDFKRRDSGLWSSHGSGLPSAKVTTYDIPFCIETPNFTLGNSVTLKFYNPLGRSFKFYIIGNGTQINDTYYCSGTSYTGVTSTETSVPYLYATIPNAKSGKYKVKTDWDGYIWTADYTNNSGTYSVKESACKPNFSNFEYSTDLSELTGNNNTIIDGKTTTNFVISTANKAVGRYSATIKKYRIECGTQKVDVDYSTSQITESISNCKSTSLKITAIDSRGIETVVSKTVENYKNYTPPTFALNKTERKNGVDTETYLNLNINFWNGNFGAKDNQITKLYYRSRKRGTTDFTNFVEIPLSNLEQEGDSVSLNDYLIHYNGTSGGYEIGVAYDIQVRVWDGNADYLFQKTDSNIITVTDGKVGFSLLKDNEGNYHVGIDGMPDTLAPLFVKGKNPTVKISSSQPTTKEDLWVDDTNKKIYARQEDGSYKEIVASFNNSISGDLSVTGTITAKNFKGNTNGYTWDINTENTSDVWMPVFNGNTIQHRVINANVNTHYNGGTSNLNNATATGWYRFANDASNRPAEMAGWGVVVVQSDGGWVFQTAYGTYSQNGVRVAHRGYINGSWTEWEYLDNRRRLIYDAPLKGGESVVLSNVKRYLDVYFLMAHNIGTLTGKYTIDSAPANVTYGSVLLLCHDVENPIEYYVSESFYDKTTKTFGHKRTGFCNISNGSFTSRNNNSGYIVYRIETYD